MFKYLFASLCATISYDLARSFTTFNSNIEFFNNNQLPIDVMLTFWHADIIILAVITLLSKEIKKRSNTNVLSLSYFRNNKLVFLFLSLPIIASNMKGYLSKSFSGAEIAPYSMLSPFLIIIFGLFVFKKEKIKLFDWILFAVCFVGFLLSSNIKISFNKLNLVLLFYPIVNAIAMVATRYISKTRNKLDGIVMDNFAYVVFGISGFIFYGGFSIRVLFSWQVLLVALFSIFHHIYIILGNQESKNTINVLVIDLAKIIFTLMSTYVFFGKNISYLQFVGMCIMVFVLWFYKLYEKKKS
jgi:drug/metabolite transporter (DMT)-like permease